jgi:hypothetical protein
MANNRIFYACQAVAIEPCYVGGMTAIHGVQSVGVNTNFNLEQAFELGQIQIYENIEGLPEIEVTLEKVLDGYPLMYHLASPNASNLGLVSRAKERSCIALGIYSDSNDAVETEGTPPVEIYMSGMYFSNLSYKIQTDGNCTESVTFVGNHKVWHTSSQKIDGAVVSSLDGTDVPYALASGFGGIQRRENVVMADCILPKSIYGVAQNSSPGNGTDVNGNPIVHIQDCSISTDLSRDNILELGRKAPYYRAPKYPVEVTCEFNVIAVSGDFVSAYEEGRPEWSQEESPNDPRQGNNTAQETIRMVLQDGTVFNLGNKNRLSSVSYGGGDANGGNVSIKYSYSTYNELTVTNPNSDPATGLYP